MTTLLEGHLNGKGLKVALISSRFNSMIVRQLELGAIDMLVRHGTAEKDITIVRVPGSFEIPAATRIAAMSGKYDAVICLGAVIRGGTPHFDYVAAEVTKGVAHVSMESPVPISLGVLTCDTIDQAVERAGTKAGNKGADAALSALEMVDVYRRLGANPSGGAARKSAGK